MKRQTKYKDAIDGSVEIVFFDVYICKKDGMAQATEQDLQYYFSLLLPSEQQSIVSLIKTFVTNRTERGESISIEEYDNELEEANADIEKGNFITHEEVKKKLMK